MNTLRQLFLIRLAFSLLTPMVTRRQEISRRRAVLPLLGFAGLWLVVVGPCFSGAAVVYDDTSGPVVFTAAGEVGDTVTLASTERYVTSISIGVICNGQHPVSDDQFQMRLWTADGPGGTAGTLLWESAYLSVSLTGPLQMISFDVPSVHVPDTLIFDVSHTDSANVFFEWSDPVTVGSSPDYAWLYLTQPLGPYYGTPANFMAHIEAVSVPEPTGLALLSLVVLTCSRCARQRIGGRTGKRGSKSGWSVLNLHANQG